MAKKMNMGSIGLDLGEATKETAAKPRSFHEQPPQPQSTVKGDLKDRAIGMTVYILPEDHKRLRMLAAETGSSLQTIALDGFDRILAEHNQKPVTRWQTRRRKHLS